MNNRILKLAPLACVALLLAGCETLPGATPPPAEPKPAAATIAPAPVAPPASSADQVALKEGIALYNNGDYNNAIKRLGAPEISASGAKAIQLSALKYMAFSYCVTSRTTLCRQQFQKAFRLDPAFDLAAGEHGHPLWGPSFARAKKAK